MVEGFTIFDHTVKAPRPDSPSAVISTISFDADTREAKFTVTIGSGDPNPETIIVPDDGTEREAFAALDPALDENARRLKAIGIAVTTAVRDRVAAMLRARSALERI